MEEEKRGGAHYRRESGRVGVVLQVSPLERDQMRAAAALVGEAMGPAVAAAGVAWARKILEERGVDLARVGRSPGAEEEPPPASRKRGRPRKTT